MATTAKSASQARARTVARHGSSRSAKAGSALAVSSTLTGRYQTTVPAFVRKTLGLAKNDKIRFVMNEGRIELQREEPVATDDPALLGFLSLLERDIAAHPERLRAIDGGLFERINHLTRDVEVDLDAPLDAADD